MSSKVRRLGSAARLMLFLAFSAHAAFAQSAGVEWERRAGAEGCASAEEITARVERVLDRRVFAAEKSAGTTIVVRGTASRDARGYRVEIAVVDRARREKETRLIRVAGDDCRKVDAALALMIAMAIEPRLSGAAVRRDQPDAAGAPDAPAQAAADTTATPATSAAEAPATRTEESRRAGERADVSANRAPEPPVAAPVEETEDDSAPSSELVMREDVAPTTDRRGWSGAGIAVTGGARVAVGLMPAPTTGFAMDVGWRPARLFAAELGVSHFPYGRRPTTAGDADFQATFGVVRLCATLPWRRLRFEACAAGDFGAFAAKGRGFDVARYDTTRFMGTLGGAFRVSARPAGHFVLRAGVSLAAPLERDTFVLDTTSGAPVELHRYSPVVTSLLLDGGWEFD